MRFEVKRCADGSLLAFLHSPDSCCHGELNEKEIRAFAKDLLKLADGELVEAGVHVPWEPEGL